MKQETSQSTIQKNNLAVPIAIVIAGALIAGAVYWSVREDSIAVAPSPQAALAPGQPPAPEDIRIDLEGWSSSSLGDPNAPVVMVGYSDFACPFCKRMHDEIMPLIKKQYIDTGKVRFVYKDMIVVGGDRAAEAAHCAAEQNAFWPYHDLLFASQAEDSGRWSDVNVHRSYAKELGLNADALAECFEKRRYQEKVLASTQEAQTNGGSGVPFTLINNRPVSGAQPFSAFQAVIDLALDDE